jgi:hypothetical protein
VGAALFLCLIGVPPRHGGERGGGVLLLLLLLLLLLPTGKPENRGMP